MAGDTRLILRGLFWLALFAFGVFGFAAGMGRRPGLFFGTFVLGSHEIRRRDHIPTPGYVLLIFGLIVVVALFYWVPLPSD